LRRGQPGLLLDRGNAQAPRVRDHGAPRRDHQAGLAAGALGRDRGGAAHPEERAAARDVSAHGRAARRAADTLATATDARKLLPLAHYGLRDGEIGGREQRRPRRSEWGSYGHGGCSSEFQRPRLASLFDVFASWSGRSSYDGATRTTA